jgi:small-conductance mechanosensitive channel
MIAWLRHAVAASAAIALLGAALAASAQIPGLPSFGSSKSGPRSDVPATAKPDAPEPEKSRIDKLLADLREDRDREPPPPPEGITDSEALAQKNALATLVHLYDRRAYADAELSRMRKARADAEAADRDWTGIVEPPPYSILQVDEWRDRADRLRGHITVVNAAIQHLDGELARAQAETHRADEALRRVTDALDRPFAEGSRERETWRRDLAELELRAAGAGALLTQIARDAKTEDLAARQAELRRLERQIAIGRQHVRFDESDLAQARQRLKDGMASLAQDRNRIARQIQERTRQRDSATREADKAPPGSPERAAAQAKLRVAQTWVDTLRNENEMVSGLPRLDEGMAQMWEQRHVLFASSDPAARREAARQLRASIDAISPWRVYLQILVGEARAQLRTAETRLLQANAGVGNTALEVEAVQAARYTVAAYERVETLIDEADRTLHHWVADGAATEKERDWRTRAIDLWLAVKDGARTLWNFELFAVEDSTVVDGQQVTTSRGVTVGKSVGAFLLFLIGYWVIGRIARQAERRLVGHGLNAARVRTVRRWAVALLSFALVLLTLNLARIPLSVFAFLGGALAIGVGFGTQTIIKNFISGMILLVERRVQIGDTIDIDGVSGVVTTVDLRSSTVRSGDGQETLVPNSVLLERSVTNWTLSDRKVRRSVRIGVAYGTAMRAAAEAIEDCAKRHGNVLANPAPQVLFEDFGDSAQILTLYFWVELSDKVGGAQVASDLRFIIEKRLAEVGIVIAAPKRDVRFDGTQPIKVEVVAVAPAAAPDAPRS